MKARRCFTGGTVSLVLVGLLSAMLRADTPAAEEWIDVEVVVNILDGADAGNLDAALDKANEAFEKAKIRLVKKATDPNAKGDTDGSGGLDRVERDQARGSGQETLDSTTGAGKGVKIDIASDVNEDDPNTNGLSIHRNPVILVEPDADPNVLGWTIAHELGHVFTLDYDLYDPNFQHRLMYGYTDRGTGLEPNEVNEVRTGAKKRGRTYFRVPRVLPGQSVAVPPGLDWTVDAHGAILDDFSDVRIVDSHGTLRDRRDPSVQYADIREVIAFVDDPFDPGGCVQLDIQFGPAPTGVFPIDAFIDVVFERDPNDPIGDLQVSLQNGQVRDVVWVNEQGPTRVAADVIVRRNDEFVGAGKPPAFYDRSIEIHIPIELVPLQLTSAQPITVRVQAGHTDSRQGWSAPPIQLFDETGPFPLALERPCHCPGLTFYRSGPAQGHAHPVGVSGCGFLPERNVELLLDGQRMARTDVLDDGSFAFNVLVATTPGQVHSAIAREVEDDVSQGGATWAPGFFILEPDEQTGPGPVSPPSTD